MSTDCIGMVGNISSCAYGMMTRTIELADHTVKIPELLTISGSLVNKGYISVLMLTQFIARRTIQLIIFAGVQN